MKKAQEILGLPIISISDGVEVGKVKSLIVNADKGAIDYIVVDSGIQILGARVIAVEHVLGIGEYALTIENENAIQDISKVTSAIDLVQKNVLITGTKVLTKKGRLIGEIGDYYVDEDVYCHIAGLEFISEGAQGELRIIPRKNVITFGKNLLVVSEDVESQLLHQVSELTPGFEIPEVEKKNLTLDDAGLSDLENNLGEEELLEDFSAELENEEEGEQSDIPEDQEEELMLEEVLPEAEFEESTPFQAQETESTVQVEKETSAASLFEQKQRQYLLGRKTTKTIYDNNGSLIANEGSVITDETVDMAKAAGKMIELVMNNKA